MGRPKGGTNHSYSQDFKLSIVQEIINGLSTNESAKLHDINKSVIRRWVKEYRTSGASALEPKRKPGNPLAKYSRRKELSEVERLTYELALAHKEIAELKKARYKEWRDAQEKK